MKKAIYAGSFDPFTNGHLDIIKQASELFDIIYLVFANNKDMKRSYNIYDMTQATVETLQSNKLDNVYVSVSDILISDFAKEQNANYLIRGLRNPNDYNYEENIAKINRELNPNLHTIYLRADNEIISSSMVKELYNYGKSISKYVNPCVLEVMKNGKY